MPSKLPSLNRMKLENILAKLEQIERQAQLTLSEYPGGLGLERQRLIAGLASQLQTYVRDQLRAGQRDSDRVVNAGVRGSGGQSLGAD